MRTQRQQEILSALREELFAEDIIREGDSIGTDDETLLRFLRARNFNMKQSKKMIHDCQKWRKTVEGVGIDELYRRIDPFDYPERVDVFKYWPLWYHKTDKKGRPLNVHFFGGLNLAELHKTVSPERHWQTLMVSAESLTREILPAASRKAGRPISQCFVVVDLKGFPVSSFWQIKDLVRASFQMSQDYYPDTMGQLMIVNAPSSFTWVWSITKRWLAKETVDKVDILGSDYHKVLLELVDEESLPSLLGGKCYCGEEGEERTGRLCLLSGVGPWLEDRVGWGPNATKVAEDEDDSSVEKSG